jgi:hypothetical protein
MGRYVNVSFACVLPGQLTALNRRAPTANYYAEPRAVRRERRQQFEVTAQVYREGCAPLLYLPPLGVRRVTVDLFGTF